MRFVGHSAYEWWKLSHARCAASANSFANKTSSKGLVNASVLVRPSEGFTELEYGTVGLTDKKYEPDPIYERQLILENEHVTLWYYPALKIVHHQMVQAPSSEEFRQLLTEGTDTLERFGAIKWLSDDRGNTLLKPQDEEWAQREWLPRVLRAGFKFWAIVLPNAAIGKLNMQRLATLHAQFGIVSRVETTPYPAFEWLKAQ